MNQDQRDKLLDLHRAAMVANVNHISGDVTTRELIAADDAFRAYLFSLPVDG